mgnify:CR=1 FL=1
MTYARDGRLPGRRRWPAESPRTFKESWKFEIGRAGHGIYTRPTTRYAGAADISKTPCGRVPPPPPPQDLSRGTLQKKIKENMFKEMETLKQIL